MAFGGVALLASVLVLRLHHHSPKSSVPVWLETLAVGHLGRIVFLHTDYKSNNQIRNDTKKMDDHDEDEAPRDTATPISSEKQWVSVGLSLEYRKLFQRLHEKDQKFQDNKRTQIKWQLVATILDICFMYVFLIINAISLIVLICILRTDWISENGQ